MLFSFLSKYKDFGLLVIRLGLGLMFVLIHGYPKLIAGPERWNSLGNSMQSVGICFAPVFWGFMSAFAETAGGAALVLGFFQRPVLVLLIINMAIATISSIGGAWLKVSYPLEILITVFALFILGPGKYSLDYLFFKKT